VPQFNQKDINLSLRLTLGLFSVKNQNKNFFNKLISRGSGELTVPVCNGIIKTRHLMFNKPCLKTTCLTALLGVFLFIAMAARAQSTDMIFENSASAMSAEATARDFYTFDFPSKKYPVKSPGKGIATAKSYSLVYTPTAALRQQTLARYTQRTKAANPALARAVTEVFAPGKNDYAMVYQQMVNSFGLSANDAGDAAVANLVLGYLIINNLQGDRPVTNAQVRGVQAQFKPALKNNSKLAAPGLAAQMGEDLKLQFVVEQAGWQSAIKRNMLPAFRESVYRAVKNTYGMDMRQMSLTGHGFEKI
jgi:hypothetical protein